MRATVGIIIIVLVLVGGAILFGGGKEANDNTTDSASSKSTARFDKISSEVSAKTAVLYDVRTQEEYDVGHFAGAVLHDVQDIERGSMPDVAKDTKIYVYCRSGNRSSQATAMLKSAGYTDVVDLGGLTDVQKMGGELIN